MSRPAYADLLESSDDEHNSYDMNDVDKILNEDEDDMPVVKNPLGQGVLKVSPERKFASSLNAVQSEEDKKRVEILLKEEEEQVPVTTKEIIDPLELVHKKEQEDMRRTEKTLRRALDIKRQFPSTKLPVIQFDEIKVISMRISSGSYGGIPSALAASLNFIVIGSTGGIITVFKKDGGELRKIGRGEFGAVTALDISPDETWFIAGYFHGQVVMWDLKSGSSVKASNTVHKRTVLSMRFWKNSRNHVISSDAEGGIHLIEYTKSFLSTSISHTCFIRNELGTCVTIEPLVPSTTMQHQTDSVRLVALGSLRYVVVAKLEPKAELLFKIVRPDGIVEGSMPCVSWNFGLAPGDAAVTDPIMAVGWGLRIQLFKIKNGTEAGFNLSGFFDIDSEIRALHWMSTDMILMLDHSREVRILNTAGFFRQANDNPRTTAQLESQYVNTELTSQAFVKDSLGRDRLSFFNSIRVVSRLVYFLGATAFHKGRLLNWKECLEALMNKGEWLEALSLGLDLFEGNGKKLNDLPTRREELVEYLEYMVTEYVKTSTISWEFKISNAIEFCIGIQSLHLLFNELFEYFVDAGTGDNNLRYFLDTLEPFILNGFIRQIPTETLGKLINYYLRVSRPDIIERIILHLDPACIDPGTILPHCVEFNLLTAYIFINTQTRAQNYTEPLRRLFEALERQTDLNKKRLYNYKMLWYARLSLRGQTFPVGSIKREMMPQVSVRIVKWLIKRKQLKSMLELDSSCYFRVLWLAFVEGIVSDTIREESLKPKPTISHKRIIEKIGRACKDSNASFQQYTLFIAKASSLKSVQITKSVCIEVAKFLIKPNQERSYTDGPSMPNATTIDSYIMLSSVAQCNDEFSQLEYNIEKKGKLIMTMLQQCEAMTPDEVNELFSIALQSPYTEVLVFLHEIKGEYSECLRSFIQCENTEVRRKVFDWIGNIFQKLGETDTGDRLKNEVLESLNVLVDIDSDKTASLVRDFYHNEHRYIIHKLDNAPQLQLKYLAELMKKTSEEEYIEEELILLYVRLLCEHNPDSLLEFLLGREDYPLDECLNLCKMFRVIDSTAYLYERLGSTKEALDLLLDVRDYIDREAATGRY